MDLDTGALNPSWKLLTNLKNIPFKIWNVFFD